MALDVAHATEPAAQQPDVRSVVSGAAWDRARPAGELDRRGPKLGAVIERLGEPDPRRGPSTRRLDGEVDPAAVESRATGRSRIRVAGERVGDREESVGVDARAGLLSRGQSWRRIGWSERLGHGRRPVGDAVLWSGGGRLVHALKPKQTEEHTGGAVGEPDLEEVCTALDLSDRSGIRRT